MYVNITGMSTQLSDKELLKRLSRGDEQAFEALFRTWYGPLVVFANRFLHDQMEAENIVQVLFINIWERRKTIKVESWKSYLKVAVRNRCMNYLSRQKHHLSIDEQLPLPDDDPGEELPDQELLDEINRAIDRMPPQRQRIFKMGRFGGLKYREIAAQLGISPKTVEVQMGQALKYLRELFAENTIRGNVPS